MAEVIDMNKHWHDTIKDLPYKNLVSVMKRSGPIIIIYVMNQLKDEDNEKYQKLLKDLNIDEDTLNKTLQFLKMSV
jgi:hypothetical protein